MVAATVIVAMGAIGFLPATASAVVPNSVPHALASGSTDDGSLSDEDAALQQAQSTGQPAEVVSARTELSDEWANPDGTFSVRSYGTPVRVWRNGAWLPTDPTLVFAADGTVQPKATTVQVAFSGGGTGPLLTGVKDGRTLSLSWPTALPTPTLDGNVATYAEILPGVDLQLKAEVEGFSQLIVVKTAAAAQNPALRTLQYTMSTVGLSVQTDATTGSVVADDPAGQAVFTSPSPLMWDSSTTATSQPAARTQATGMAADTTSAGPGGAFEPPPGTQDAQMATSVSGNQLSITPDQALLTDSSTIYPVYIDPSWAWGVRQDWTRVYRKYPNTSYWNANEVARVGYENETYGLSRSFFQWNTSNIEDAAVIKSTFRIKNVWSWSCQARPVELWETGPISKATTWNNQPSKIGSSPLATVNDARGWDNSNSACAAANLEFDLTPRIRTAAAAQRAHITLGLYASDEADTYGWKKFDPKTAVLETEYNHAPKKPSNPGTNPKTNCSAGGTIGNTSISLHATIDDADGGNLTAEFQLFAAGSGTPVADKTVPALKGRVATLVLPDSTTPTGSYTWKVQSKDDQGTTSAWSDTCKFSVDRTRPGRPPVISSTVFPPGDSGWPATTGKARTPGAFTFAANGISDVVRYFYYTDNDPEVKEVDVAAGAGATVSVTPPGVGPHLVYAYSQDSAGNRSDTATYLYYAARSQDRDPPHDLNGDSNGDIWSVDTNGTLVTYAGQGNGQFTGATNGGQSFDLATQVTSDGDWGEDGYNDLITLEPGTGGTKDVWVYPNNGEGTATVDGVDTGKRKLAVTCPAVDEDMGCSAADVEDHWFDASQIVAPGDIMSTPAPDLLVKEGSRLWAYCGGRLDNQLDDCGSPTLVGTIDWSGYTVVAPGDLNGDGVPDLLLRNDASGTVYRSYGQKDPVTGTVDLATWGSNAVAVTAAGAFKAATYPVMGSSGDLTGDGIPDVWARATDNTMVAWPGTGTASGLTGFGASFTVDGVTGGTHIPSGTTIASGQSYSSNAAKLTMGADGNLVVTSRTGATLWSTATGGHPGATARMQTDGDLVVYDTDGSTKLWESGSHGANGYALLQDRGNFVVYNAKGQSLWAAGTEVRNDYNGDGRSDMAAWYDYADTSSGMVTFTGNSDGTLGNPAKSYTSQPGSWNTSRMQFASGDYNGDGRSDMATLYDYGNGKIEIFVSLANAGGGFNAPTVAYTSRENSWYEANMTLESGDFNGDGRDDLAVWYSYYTGEDTLFTFTSNAHGTFNAPFPSWTNTDNDWNVHQMKFTTGDFNGDGRDDLAALYGYADGHVTMFSFLTNPQGGFQSSLSSWTSATWGDWNRTYLQAGDFNGDGKDDVAAWYDYADGHDALHTLLSYATGTGAFTSPVQSWSSAAGNFNHDHLKMVSGDFNGDGRDDLAALYGYTDGTNTSRMFSWLGTSTGGFAGSYTGWSSTVWTWSNFTFINRYN